MSSDIEILFSTNAAVAAREIDQATASTTKATVAVEKMAVTQTRMNSSWTGALKGVRGLGLAVGLMGAEFGGAIGKMVGLTTAGLAIGGPAGAAIGAGIGAISSAIGFMGDRAESSAKQLEDAKNKVDALSKAYRQAVSAAAGEGGSALGTYGKGMREGVAEGSAGLPLFGKGPVVMLESDKFKNMSIEDLQKAGAAGLKTKEDIERVATYKSYGADTDEAISRVAAPGGMFGKQFQSYGQKGPEISSLDAQQAYENSAGIKQYNELLGGGYTEAVKENAAATKNLADEMRKAREAAEAGGASVAPTTGLIIK